jgi:hypothetical protein
MLTTCADVASTPGSATSSATIYAMFDGSGNRAGKVKPGCKLDASWPSNYGDIYFRNNCLVDSSGKYHHPCQPFLSGIYFSTSNGFAIL